MTGSVHEKVRQQHGIPFRNGETLPQDSHAAQETARAIRVHPAALVAAAGVVTAAAVVVAVVPHQHAAPGGGHPAAGPTPQPSPSASAGHGGLCVDLLGLWVCV